MQGSGLSLSLMRARMQWLNARQTRLAENVAQADTPGFRPRDLAPFQPGREGAIALSRSSAGHLGGATGGAGISTVAGSTFETRPSGNAVSLEDEMLKLSETQMEYQMVAGLYQRSLGSLKTAIGRRG